jgi:hypothetical protein
MPDDYTAVENIVFVVTRTIDYQCTLLGVFTSLPDVKACVVESLQEKWGVAIYGWEHLPGLKPIAQESEIEITETLDVQFSRGDLSINKMHDIFRVPLNQKIDETLYIE